MAGVLGIIANPASGKDVRRLVSGASVFDNQEKRNILRRAVVGAVRAGETCFRPLLDTYGIAQSALDGAAGGCDVAPVDVTLTDSALDTSQAAKQMKEAGCGAVLVLGGDGTNRAATKGWQDIPVVAVSTGTNNVFPQMIEGTLAGLAAALITTGRIALTAAAHRAKMIHVVIAGERDDLALIDAALIEEPFLGAKAVWHPESLRALVLTCAEPTSVGLSALGAQLSPLSREADAGLYLAVGRPGRGVTAAIAPGLFASVPVRESRELTFGEEVILSGPGVLALDGERERRLKPGQQAHLHVSRDGPWVIDVAKTLEIAARDGLFLEDATDGN